jgi:hypothetical protein
LTWDRRAGNHPFLRAPNKTPTRQLRSAIAASRTALWLASGWGYRPDVGSIGIRSLRGSRLQGAGASHSQVRQRSRPAVPDDPAVVKNFLKFGGGGKALPGCQVCLATHTHRDSPSVIQSEKPFILDGLPLRGDTCWQAKGTAMKCTVWVSALILGTIALMGVDASAGQFKKAVYYHAGQQPRHVSAAQLTSSADVDLVFADYLSNQVVTLLGNGDGTFQKPIQFPAPSPISLAVGDFDEDGNQDLAVVETSAGNGSIAIFLGDGAGHFKLSATYRTGVAPSSVATADFSGDGHLGLAVANNGGQSGKGSVMVFAGTGKGTFETPVTYKIAGAPWGIAAGDLNGDHSPDIAVTNLGGDVSTLINDGTGKFLNPITYNAGGGEVVDVKIADLRNHGKQDLVIANGSQGMVVLLNKGNGTFGKPAIYRPCAGYCSAGPGACTVADFNLDGKLDVACSANIDDSYFFYGKGDGTFGTAIAIANTIKNQGGFSIAAGDFNNDHASDLAIPIQNYGKVAIMLNTK